MSLPLAQWLPRQRWYGGRGRTLASIDTAVSIPLDGDGDGGAGDTGETLDLTLVDVGYTDGVVERYQLLVRWGDAPGTGSGTGAPVDHIGVDYIGIDDRGRHGYDALHDPGAAARLLALVDASAPRGALRFLREPGASLPVGTPARVVGAEQSNTSVVFGTAAILKVFRRVTVGINPDIELNRVLGRAGNRHVATLLGSYGLGDGDDGASLGMVTAFAAGSSEGWDIATAAARTLIEGVLGEGCCVDRFFVDEARRLGEAVASVHAGLAEGLGAGTAPFPAAAMQQRLTAAASVVEPLRGRVPEIAARIGALGEATVTVQRMHGDLHLGQVLRTPAGWLLIDFEGEPGQPPAERRRPDSPLRDVAGMLRSFEYAAYAQLVDREPDDQRRLAAPLADWVRDLREAFCDGYAAVAGEDPRLHGGVLAAYELDKAVYETAYEARFRPAWLPIPLRSVDRLLG